MEFAEIPQNLRIRGEYEKELNRRGHATAEQRGEWELAIPRRISEKAVEKASEFIADVGLDLDAEDSDEIGIDIERE